MPAPLVRPSVPRDPASSGRRVALGQDAHPFGPGEPLRLGGVEITGAPRLHGHSDGDVVLHAVAGGLLAAAGLPDLGQLFPAGPATPSGVASTALLADVVGRVAAAGQRATAVDLTIVGARPRLAAWLEPIAASVASALGVAVEVVTIKASTGNLLGAEGAGRAISALALVTVEPVGSDVDEIGR
jgi:2-C-methyl-D-erythritol 2,4-cyclodiphosphate synthase